MTGMEEKRATLKDCLTQLQITLNILNLNNLFCGIVTRIDAGTGSKLKFIFHYKLIL